MFASLFPLKPKWRYAIPLLAVGWVLFLRGPSFGVTLWNVDESIHAAVAQRMLDGGLLYRDAIDQRTPVSYYFFEGVFALFGPQNLPAVRVLVAVLIGLTAGALFWFGRRAFNRVTGGWAALIFAALSTSLLDPGDANAANTEWFAIFFTTAGAGALWLALSRSSGGFAALSGVSYALGFLSKQPALLDAFPPLALIVAGIGTKQWTIARGLRTAFFYALGFLGMIAATMAHFAWRGAWAPAIFYTWTYNLNYYGPEISSVDRALTLAVPFRLLGKSYPWLLAVGGFAAVTACLRLVQFRWKPEERKENGWILFVLLWNATALAGATAGGRGFEHYYIQWLPAGSLLCAWVLGHLAPAVLRAWKANSRPRRILGGLIFGAAALGVLHLLARPIAVRHAAPPPEDPARRASAFIQTHTRADESIFVWGFNPDIYLYTQRPAASRFVYCSFLTGLIPWTNIAPEKDTHYAIVPGAMEQLLADLQSARPAFIVDCSAGPHRRFAKYPIADFAPLRDYVAAHYVEVESAQFVPQGFRLHLIKDSSRAAQITLDATATEGVPPAPGVFGDTTVGPTPTVVLVSGDDPAAKLQRLELWADDQLVDSATFFPTSHMTLGFLVPYDRLGVGPHRLKAIARNGSGAPAESTVLNVACDDSAVPREKLADFALPLVDRVVAPFSVRAPFGPAAGWEEGHRMFSAHATSVLAYPITDIARVQGQFGIRAGAYASENGAPTDGAEFAVTWIAAAGERHVLLRRLLRPREEPADRGPQAFNLELPPAARGGRIEFSVNPGPAGNAASDWTYWSDLLLQASR